MNHFDSSTIVHFALLFTVTVSGVCIYAIHRGHPVELNLEDRAIKLKIGPVILEETATQLLPKDAE